MEEITKRGECFGNSKPNEDLGLYYYYKNGNLHELLKSSGSLEKDKKMIEYRNLIISQDKKMKEYTNTGSEREFNNLNNLFNWKRTDLKEEKDIVAFCMAENNISDYEILYSMKIDVHYGDKVIVLTKINNQFRYVVYTAGYTVGLFDDSFIEPIEQAVAKINSNKTLKTKTFQRSNNQKTYNLELDKVTMYTKNNQVLKVVNFKNLNYNNPNIKSHTIITTVYLKDDKPIFAEREGKVKYTNSATEQLPKREMKNYYVDYFDKNNRKIVIKPNLDYGGNYIFLNDELERLLDEVKSNL